MKRIVKAYTSFTRMERVGVVALCGVMFILIGIRATMHYWVHPANNADEEKKLAASWEVFKRSQPQVKNTDTTKEDNEGNRDNYQDAFDDDEAPLPNIININTADSATLVRLKGIGPATASKIIARRAQKGPFTSVEQLREVSHMPNATFEILKKHLSVEIAK